MAALGKLIYLIQMVYLDRNYLKKQPSLNCLNTFTKELYDIYVVFIINSLAIGFIDLSTFDNHKSNLPLFILCLFGFNEDI
jgi:hypothetical protein